MPKKVSKKAVKKVATKVKKAPVKNVVKKAATKKVAAKSAKKTTKTPVKKASKKDVKAHVCNIVKDDPAREYRIEMEIVVDAYDPVERMVGWICSIEDVLCNNVRCKCRKARSMSPLKVGDEVDVIEVGSEDDCVGEIFVFVQWNDRKLTVPLEQLEPISGDPKAIEIIEDWLYWCLMGYEF